MNAPIAVLDIGAGYGAFATAVLERFPNATVVGLDFSEPMMAVGGERMARFGERFSYVVGDIAQGELPADLHGPFDAAVASASIVHLPTEPKQRIYGGVFRVLKPGGCSSMSTLSVPPTRTCGSGIALGLKANVTVVALSRTRRSSTGGCCTTSSKARRPVTTTLTC